MDSDSFGTLLFAMIIGVDTFAGGIWFSSGVSSNIGKSSISIFLSKLFSSDVDTSI